MQYVLRGQAGLVGSQAAERIGAFEVSKIVKTSAADIGNIDAEIERVPAALVIHRVGSVEVIFGFTKIGLSAASGISPLHHDACLLMQARKPVIIMPHQKTKLIHPPRRKYVAV